MNIETKNIINSILRNITNFFSLNSFRVKITSFLRKQYSEGLETDEIKFGFNFLEKDSDVTFLSEYVNDKLESHTDAIGQALKDELSRGILNGEDVSGLKERVTSVLKEDKFKNRLKTVIRTEGKRARSKGQLEGAIQADQLGIKQRKWIEIVVDNVTSEVSFAMDEKYGEPEKAISLDEEFTVTVKIGKKVKTFHGLTPPFMPNDRDSMRFVRVDEEEDQ